MRPRHLPLFALLLTGVTACGGGGGGSDSKPVATPAPKNTKDLSIPDGFSYQTDHQVRFTFTLRYPTGAPVSGSAVRVYRQTDDANLPRREDLLYQGLTDATGKLDDIVGLPSDVEEITVVTSVLGSRNRVDLPLDSETITYTFE